MVTGMDILRNVTFMLLLFYVEDLTPRTIEVDQNYGIDDRNCTNRYHPCKTLNYVFLKGGAGDILNKTVVLLYSGVHELNSSLNLKYIDDMSIVSNQSAIINCTKKNTGFTYMHVSNIKYENITIQNCGVHRQSTTVINNNSESINNHQNIIVRVTFIYSNSITIIHSNFWHNKGIAIAFYDVGTYIKIEDNHFSTNLEIGKQSSNFL